ncbi:MAG TPA: M20/M25/M40 family metallo-hydrolase [Candidatus Saccharimonadales bacterium]|nr:M20/M25/M40 family metallo-hydrolase [Candidatus Saccharimonadales bacterium]
METILKTLVEIPSTSNNPLAIQKALTFMAEFVADRGMHVERFTSQGVPSFVATTKSHDRTPSLLLVAHIDVVPAPKQLFTLRKKKGNYHGRGVFDMKFAAAAYLRLVDELRESLGDYSLGIMVTTDEEIGGQNGVKYLVETEGYRPKVCIIPDGGPDWEVEGFEKGVQWVQLDATGVSAHASRPWEGEHAIHKLLMAIEEIRPLFPYNAGKKDTLLSVGTIEGGETANQLADHAKAVLDIRTGSVADHRRSIPAITEICAKHDVQVTVLVDDEPCVNDAANPYIHLYRDLLREHIGQATEMSYSYAVTDGRFFSRQGIPCVIVQPPGGGNHGQNEWISIKGCQQFYEVLRRYTKKVAGEQRPENFNS